MQLPPADLVALQDANEKIIAAVKQEVAKVMAMNNQGTKKYNIPCIMVVTPDTYNVVDINKALVAHYKQQADGNPN